MPLKCLIDTRCLQAAVHYDRLGKARDAEEQEQVDHAAQNRLKSFLARIESCGYSPEASKGEPGELRLSLLKNYQCLVLTTRIYQLSESELNDIMEFVEQGNSLLVMSNHTPFEERDNTLARKLGFSFKSPDYPWHMGGFGVSTIKDSCLTEHQITHGLKQGIVSFFKWGYGLT